MKLLINSFGLFFDILGALSIFKFGIPAKIDKKGSIHLILQQEDVFEKERAKKYEKFSYIGLSLLLVGFFMQLISNFIR